MSQFQFVVTNTEGQRYTGTMVAADIEAAMKSLVEKDLVVTRIQPMSSRPVARQALDLLGVPERSPMSGEALIAFTQQLSAMLDSGVTVKEALDVMAGDATTPGVRLMLLDMATKVGAGHSVAEVLTLYPNVFSRQYIATIAAGESGGNLPGALAVMAQLLEKSEGLRRKVASAFYYPAFILGMAGVFLALMLVVVVPRYAAFYNTLGGNLPFSTRLVMGAGEFAQQHFIGLLMLAMVVTGGVFRLARSPRGQLALDSLKLRLPMLGHLFRLLAIARFSRTLSSLIASGLPLVQAVALTAETMGNVVMEQAVARVPSQLMEGRSVVEALRTCGVFTRMSLSMVSVGEQSGRLDTMLDKIATYYEERVDHAVRALASLIEPAVILFVGLIVAAMVIALVLPVFGLVTLFVK